MLIQKLRGRVGSRLSGNSEAGFTLIELLVVMLILGILAAIAIPAFFNQKQKANDAQAKAFAHSAQVAMETYSTDHNGSYLNATALILQQIEPTLSNAQLTLVPAPTATGYTVTVTVPNTNPAHTFSVTRAAGGALTYPCAPVVAGQGAGGCPPSGFWG